MKDLSTLIKYCDNGEWITLADGSKFLSVGNNSLALFQLITDQLCLGCSWETRLAFLVFVSTYLHYWLTRGELI